MADEQATPGRFWPRHVSWLTIVLAFLAIVSFLAISRPGAPYAVPMGISGGGMEYSGSSAPVPSTPSTPMRDGSVSNASPQGGKGGGAYYPYPYNPEVPVADTREFLKVNYNDTMRTRDVQGLTRRVETTVRGHSGRIDGESSSPQSGYVSFAVPQSKFEAFRTELEGLVNSRFLTVNISSQNLLPQKQSIEEQQKQADAWLAEYKTDRQRVITVHTNNVKAIQAKIDLPQSSDSRAVFEQELANENASYTKQLSQADANIKYAQDWQKAMQTQDQALLDNVATVTGTVSIQWISLWEMAQAYLPGYWIPGIFALLAFLSLLWDRRRFGIV